MALGVHVVTQVMAIAIRAEEGWPIEAVLADVLEVCGEIDVQPPPRRASWKGEVKFVRGVPPAIPRWWPRWALSVPDPARAERYTRYFSRVLAVGGILGLVIGSSLVVSGESGAWFHTIWSVAILWQAWTLAGHGRESARFVALHLVPALFFLILAVTGGVKCIQYLAQGNASRALIALVGASLGLLFVVVGLPRTIREWPRRSGPQRLQS